MCTPMKPSPQSRQQTFNQSQRLPCALLSSLTPSLPSPPILTSLQIRIYLVKHILKLTHFFHSSCHSLDPRFRYFIPGFLRWPFHISSSDNHLKYSLDLSTFNSSLSNFQDLYNQNSSNFLFFLFCSMMPMPE